MSLCHICAPRTNTALCEWRHQRWPPPLYTQSSESAQVGGRIRNIYIFCLTGKRCTFYIKENISHSNRFLASATPDDHIFESHDRSKCPINCKSKKQWVQLLIGDNEFQGMVQGDGRQTPHTILPVTKHRHGESVLVAGAEVCVAAVLRVAQVGQGQGENLLHLEEKKAAGEQLNFQFSSFSEGFITFALKMRKVMFWSPCIYLFICMRVIRISKKVLNRIAWNLVGWLVINWGPFDKILGSIGSKVMVMKRSISSFYHIYIQLACN